MKKIPYLMAQEAVALEGYTFLKEQKQSSSFDKIEELVTIRDWFPVFHSGYYAIVGINDSTNEEIMSEPIIGVLEGSHHVFESPRKYYKLKGKYSLMSFVLFHTSYDTTYNKDLSYFLNEDFKDGFPKNWILSIHQLDILIRELSQSLPGEMTKRINHSFKELKDPRSNYFVTPVDSNVKDMFDKVFTMIKKRQNWRDFMSEELRRSGHGEVISKLKVKKIPNQCPPKKGRLSDFRSLFLWFPEKDTASASYFMTGYLLNEDKELEEFRSKIVLVHNTGMHVVTEDRSVMLLGTICTTEIEKSDHAYIVNALTAWHVRGLWYGLQENWRDLVTVIDIARSMRFDHQHVA